MKWRFDDVMAFVRVMEAGSITAAADRMNLSKSGISKRIADLECALGVELFRRSTRRMIPTEAGEAYYQRMAPLLHELGDTIGSISAPGGNALQGQLRVTMPISFGVMYLGSTVARFAREHPELEIAVDYDDRWVDLARDGYHLGIGVERPAEPGLESHRLCECPRVICCSPAYAEERGIPQTVPELAEHTSIGYAHIDAERWWRVENPQTVRTITPGRRRILANNGEAVRNLVMAGLGIAPMPMFMIAQQIREGTLIPLLVDDGLPPAVIAVSYPSAYRSSAKVRAFIGFLSEFFSRPYPWEMGNAIGAEM